LAGGEELMKLLLLLACLLAPMAASAVTPALLQVEQCPFTSGTSLTCTFSSPIASGGFYTVAVTIFGGPLITGVSSSLGNTPTDLGVSTNFSAFSTVVKAMENTTGGTETVTVTTSGSVTSGAVVLLQEYSGIATSSVQDGTTQLADVFSGCPLNFPSITTTNASDLIIAYAFERGANQPFTALGSFSLDNQGNAGATAGAALSLAVSSTGTYTPQLTAASCGAFYNVSTIALKSFVAPPDSFQFGLVGP
jgi:predicted RecA/RadA family phage recombinase